MIKSPIPRPPAAYNVALAEIKRQQQALHKVSLWLKLHQKAINAMLRRFDKAPEGILPYAPSVNAYETFGSAVFTINVSCRDLPGFKCERLAALLELFVDADRTRSSDYAEYLNRDYTFEFDVEGGGEIRVCIGAYAKPESPTCQRILKETKIVTREEKVYEMVCSDEAQPAAEVAPE
jgi:hypothetical protein